MDDLEARTFTSPGTGLTMSYRLFIPRNIDPAHPPAVLLFLHGAGERGNDNRRQVANGAMAWLDPQVQDRSPTIVVFPQCPSGAQWVNTPWDNGSYGQASIPISKPLATALEILADVRARHGVDPTRVLITGVSMGGYGTWDAILRNPTLFAGAMAVCGAGDPSRASVIKDLPIWAFHGDEDDVVPVSGSRDMVNALKAAGGAPRYTGYAGVRHNSWDRAYGTAEAIEWLLSRKRPASR